MVCMAAVRATSTRRWYALANSLDCRVRRDSNSRFVLAACSRLACKSSTRLRNTAFSWWSGKRAAICFSFSAMTASRACTSFCTSFTLNSSNNRFLSVSCKDDFKRFRSSSRCFVPFRGAGGTPASLPSRLNTLHTVCICFRNRFAVAKSPSTKGFFKQRKYHRNEEKHAPQHKTAREEGEE